jgi:anion-transporting  ArsA/GET3 family ATPase
VTLADVMASHRMVVLVGTGGVGKTTLSAALAWGAARHGRRAMVLTIDPARALGRAFGVGLGPEPTPIAGAEGRLFGAMLDRQRAWDALVLRHAPNRDVAASILANPFYLELSRRFAGGAEYAAMEELGRLEESGLFDLIVLDTPPAQHALDFVRAPERIDRLLEPELSRWLVEPSRALAGGALFATSGTVRFLVRRIAHATGRRTLADIAGFFTAFGQMMDEVRKRSQRVRRLLRSAETAFVLVTGPRQSVLDESGVLADRIAELEIPLRAVVVNRVHAAPPSDGDASSLLSELGVAGHAEPAIAWLARTRRDAARLAEVERRRIARFAGALPRDLAWSLVDELSHDLHAASDLDRVAATLYSGDVAFG